MGWFIYSACNPKKSHQQKSLNIEISEYNLKGEQIVNSLIQYIKSKDPNLNILVNKRIDVNEVICIKYFNYNEGRIIYRGNDLNETLFDSIYRNIIIIND